MMKSSNNVFTYLGLLIALFGITLSTYLLKGATFFGSSYLAQVIFSDLKKWILVFIIVLIIRLLEKRKFQSNGIKGINLKVILSGIIFGLIAVVVSILTLGLLFNILGLKEPSTLGAINELPIYIKLFTITTVAITEEIFYRGYAIERLGEITGNYIFGGILSGIVFLAIHFPAWGLAGAVPQIIFTIFLTVFYLKKRDLISTILMHWTINFLMIIVLPNFM